MTPIHPQEPMPAIAAGGACVLLHHQLPDKSWHVDWMMERRDEKASLASARGLITFRLPKRVDELAEDAAMEAEHIGDHRRAYLEYEGEVSGARGSVRRLAQGEIIAVETLSQGPRAAIGLLIRWVGQGSPSAARQERGPQSSHGPAGGRLPHFMQRLILEHEGGEGVRQSDGRRWIVRCASRELTAQ